mmetsp:Transcript_85679/g.199142  ORF Transcript_85679/g.199142 Transcript_85679/m.199142 type:complete len:152 (-) Transcript_85679:380-835(-)
MPRQVFPADTTPESPSDVHKARVARSPHQLRCKIRDAASGASERSDAHSVVLNQQPYSPTAGCVDHNTDGACLCEDGDHESGAPAACRDLLLCSDARGVDEEVGAKQCFCQLERRTAHLVRPAKALLASLSTGATSISASSAFFAICSANR